MAPAPLTDLANVQGDILLKGLPKNVETFWFFTISDTHKFCKALRTVATEEISHTQNTRDARKQIRDSKANCGATTTTEQLPTVGANISFSAKGLHKISIVTGADLRTGDEENFEKGMRSSAVTTLQDPVQEDLVTPKWDHEWLSDNIDGVLLVTGPNPGLVQVKLDRIVKLFDDSFRLAFKNEGNVRPGDQRGHEHFGYQDTISQPFVANLPVDKLENFAPPGQDTIAQGIILCGRPGDIKADERPAWTLDGSFLAFRKLKQNVQDFDNFLQTSANSLGMYKDQLGARLIGRWKSGCPVNLSPDHDDLSIGDDPTKTLDFEFDHDGIDISQIIFRGELAATKLVCPIGAHIRKTNPRGDQPAGEPATGGAAAGRPSVNIHRVIRSGIPFGPEISEDANAERGLLFVCYQSNIDNGFAFIQKVWANDESFRFRGAGIDAIMGQTNDKAEVEMHGLFPQDATRPLSLSGVNRFVVPQGGEYFFSPSLAALKGVLSEVKAAGRNGTNGTNGASGAHGADGANGANGPNWHKEL